MAGTKPGHDEEVRENLKSLVRKMLPSDMLTPVRYERRHLHGRVLVA
jgi:hypothetical protein